MKERIMKIFKLLFIILLTSISLNAYASNSHLDKAIDFVNLYHPQTATEGNVEMVLGSILKTNPSWKKNSKEIRQFFLRKLSSNEYRHALARIYMSEFTENELKELSTFYATSLGKRTIKSMPKVNYLTMQMSNGYFKAIMPELVSIINK